MIGAVPAASVDDAVAAARPRLLALAYRMLGSMADAEDVVQDAIVKARRAMPPDVDSPVAYLTTVTTRTALDHLRSARVRRESYVGPWLPEPIAVDPAPDGAARAELAESVSMAFLVQLEALSPEERAVLLLHDVFGYAHAEIASMLDRSEGACRQLLRRARRHLDANRPRFAVDRGRQQELVRRFLHACTTGDVASFLAVLADDATLVSDGGAEVKAARRPILGAWRVARFLAGVLRRKAATGSARLLSLHGEPVLALLDGSRLDSLVFVAPAADGDDRIGTVWFLRNPTKLDRVRPLVEQAGP